MACLFGCGGTLKMLFHSVSRTRLSLESMTWSVLFERE
jgi:hypothetical protein